MAHTLAGSLTAVQKAKFKETEEALETTALDIEREKAAQVRGGGGPKRVCCLHSNWALPLLRLLRHAAGQASIVLLLVLLLLLCVLCRSRSRQSMRSTRRCCNTKKPCWGRYSVAQRCAP